MARGRRLLGPVRIPVPPHPQGRSRGLVLQSVRLPRSSGGPRGLPLGPCRLEARLAACVERDHLGWTRHRFGACRDPHEMKMHLGSSLSCRASGISGVAVSKPTTSCGSATEPAARWSDRPDSNRHRGDHDPGCLPLHHSHLMGVTLGGDDRTRTGGLSVDNRALCAPELRPQVARVGFEPTVSSSRGSREQPLLYCASRHVPNRSGRQESNLRSPAPEAGGVADSPTARRTIETLRSTPGGTRTRSLRVEGPASSPVRPRGRESSGGRARTCGLAGNNRASFQLDHAGTEGEGVEPPKPQRAHPFSRRDTAPVAVLPEVAPAGVEPAPTRVRTGSSAV
jgi:hypothetical protein